MHPATTGDSTKYLQADLAIPRRLLIDPLIFSLELRSRGRLEVESESVATPTLDRGGGMSRTSTIGLQQSHAARNDWSAYALLLTAVSIRSSKRAEKSAIPPCNSFVRRLIP